MSYLPDKKTQSLPPIRIAARLGIALMSLAAKADLPLSTYVARVLERHAFGHALSLEQDSQLHNEDGALRGTATTPGELR